MASRGKARRRYYSQVKCHLCGLPIDTNIVSSRHPLVGTIDHLIPRAHGGRDTADNRAPAHRCCNHVRNTDSITLELKGRCLQLAVSEFAKMHTIGTGKKWKYVRQLVLAYRSHSPKND